MKFLRTNRKTGHPPVQTLVPAPGFQPFRFPGSCPTSIRVANSLSVCLYVWATPRGSRLPGIMSSLTAGLSLMAKPSRLSGPELQGEHLRVGAQEARTKENDSRFWRIKLGLKLWLRHRFPFPYVFPSLFSSFLPSIQHVLTKHLPWVFQP